MRASCLIRDPGHYGRPIVLAGLKKVGFDLVPHIHDPRAGDLLVIWNRYGRGDQEAARFERAGAAVIVVENGYLGHRYSAHAKPFDQHGEQLYAMALWHHNGAGGWAVGEPGRWREQGIEVRPWRTGGDYVLVLPQRGIGPRGVAMPREWPEKAVRRLQAMTERRVRVRSHPGNVPAVRSLERDLEGAWCAVTWGSCAALRAICYGVSVLSEFPQWIGRSACVSRDWAIEQVGRYADILDARDRMLDRLAWAQWSTSEIATGEPFIALMSRYHEGREST